MPCWRLRRHPARGRDGRLVLWTVMPLGSVANDRLRHVLIGYARVSKADGSQSLDLQRDALQVEGVAAKSTVVMGEVSWRTGRKVWHVKVQTARCVRQRISAVLEWAIAMNLRSDNPCDRLGPVLGKQHEVVRHMRALPHRDVASAVATVRASDAAEAVKLALEFLVLTAARWGGRHTIGLAALAGEHDRSSKDGGLRCDGATATVIPAVIRVHSTNHGPARRNEACGRRERRWCRVGVRVPDADRPAPPTTAAGTKALRQAWR